MIGLLRGRIVDSAADGTITIDVQGVGYEVSTPLGCEGQLEPDPEGSVTLFIHTVVREDALELYGFGTREQRGAFRSLIAVSKVGPKIGLSVLGTMSVGDLARAIAANAPKSLTAVPGIGKRTAERILLELQGKLEAPTSNEGTPRPQIGLEEGAAGQLRAALVRMGFRSSEADRAVAAVAPHDRPLADLVREALKILAP